jgi:hypothetical protein
LREFSAEGFVLGICGGHAFFARREFSNHTLKGFKAPTTGFASLTIRTLALFVPKKFSISGPREITENNADSLHRRRLDSTAICSPRRKSIAHCERARRDFGWWRGDAMQIVGKIEMSSVVRV